MSNSPRDLASRIPVTLFAIVTGLGGLGHAWRAAAPGTTTADEIGEVLLILAAVLWVLLAAAYFAKWARAPALARAEWEHPLQGTFVALMPASLLLILPGLAPRLGSGGHVLFFILVPVQVAVMAALIARWLMVPQDLARITPAWHLAFVAGHLFAASAAATFGYSLTGWCFFGAGVIAWFAVDSILLNRLMTHEPLAAALRPTLAVELAPPAVALNAYAALLPGEADFVALGLFGSALFVAIVLLFLARRLCEAPFGPGYWAFGFPVASLSAGAWRIAHATAADAAWYLALALFVLANGVLLALGALSIAALAKGRFLPR